MLDIATGTGDFAILAAQMLKPQRLVGADISEGMMAVGAEKVKAAGLQDVISFAKEDCLNLSYADGTFDAVTAAFGIRNFADLDKGLREMCRVLRPDGREETVRIIKAYDEPSAQSMVSINALADSMEAAIASRAVAGVGYLKHATGELLQTGTTTINGDALFSVPFVDDQYMVFPGLEGARQLTAQVVTGSKSATKCSLAVYNDVGTRTYAKVAYLAFGRWK